MYTVFSNLYVPMLLLSQKWYILKAIQFYIQVNGKKSRIYPLGVCLVPILNDFFLTIIITKTPYSNVLKILQPKNENFQIKISDIFSYFCSKHRLWALVRTCGHSLEPPRRGGSNEYPQFVLSRNKKNNVYPCKPQFYYIKMGFKGVKII